MKKETLIKKLLTEKAEKNNTIDLNAYALGLDAMYEALVLSCVSSSAFVIIDMKGHIDGVTLTEQTAIDYVEEYNKTVDDADDKIKYEVVEVF